MGEVCFKLVCRVDVVSVRTGSVLRRFHSSDSNSFRLTGIFSILQHLIHLKCIMGSLL